jgi:adenylate cyclase
MSDPTKISRRLVAVFAADVEGYSRLMGAEEVGTLKRLTERRATGDNPHRSASTLTHGLL